jgi:hypothetical protein
MASSSDSAAIPNYSKRARSTCRRGGANREATSPSGKPPNFALSEPSAKGRINATRGQLQAAKDSDVPGGLFARATRRSN